LGKSPGCRKHKGGKISGGRDEFEQAPGGEGSSGNVRTSKVQNSLRRLEVSEGNTEGLNHVWGGREKREIYSENDVV